MRGRTPGKRPRSPSPAGGLPRATPQLPAWALVLPPLVAAAIVHGGTLGGFFAADDIDFLARARGLDPTPWGWARPLSGRLRWQLLTAWFGAEPLPHLLLAWLLHLTSAVLVGRIAVLAGRGRAAATTASVLVAATSIAYTSTRWPSALSEPMAAAFALGALALHLECRRNARPTLAWSAGACAIAAVAAKESTVLLPVAVWAFDRLVPVRGEGRGALREVAICGSLTAVAAVTAYIVAPHLAGAAYALDARPAALAANLLTYGAWLVRVLDPVRDRSAVPQPRLAVWGLALFAVWLVAMWTERRTAVRTAAAGFAWFILFLVPVLPLARHTYLYYLVLPFAGAALAAGDLLGRATRRLPAWLGPVALGSLVGLMVVNEALQAHERASLRVGGVLVDRVSRESEQLRNAVTDLRRAGVARGDTIGLVNPFPVRSFDPTTGSERAPGIEPGPTRYLPVVAALRDGAALHLFLPGVTVLGMLDGIPPDWSRARVFRFDNDGHLHDQGRGITALDSLATDYLLGERFAEARVTLERVIEHGTDGPEVRWRLCCALSGLGEDSAAAVEARGLVARWPDSPRARTMMAEDRARTAAERERR